MMNTNTVMRLTLRAVGVAAVCVASAVAQPIFSDDFTSTPSVLWGNERGAWAASGGSYAAGVPANNPPTMSSLPFDLGDFEFRCTIREVNDGGIWLRSNAQGTGVLLVFARRDVYWHTMVNNGAGGALNSVNDTYDIGDTLEVRVTVVGDLYSVFINGSPTAITTLTTPNYPVGRVALYDYTANQMRFDNIEVLESSATCWPAKVSKHPGSASSCPAGTATTVEAAGRSTIAYQWQWLDGEGVWQDLADGTVAAGPPVEVGGTDTATLSMFAGSMCCDGPKSILARCVVSNACGSETSNEATLTLCPSDKDCDGDADSDDIIAFFTAWDNADDAGDVDGDGDTDSDDIVIYFGAWDSGC